MFLSSLTGQGALLPSTAVASTGGDSSNCLTPTAGAKTPVKGPQIMTRRPLQLCRPDGCRPDGQRCAAPTACRAHGAVCRPGRRAALPVGRADDDRLGGHDVLLHGGGKDIVVYRVGLGEALSGAAAPVFLDEYSPSGVLLQSVALPAVSASGAGNQQGLGRLGHGELGGPPLALRRRARPGGDRVQLHVQPDRFDESQFCGIVGHQPHRGPGGGVDDAVNTTTSLTDEATGNNVRSAVSDNGQEVWVSGADAANGVRYAPVGASTSTGILASSNGRQAGSTTVSSTSRLIPPRTASSRSPPSGRACPRPAR